MMSEFTDDITMRRGNTYERQVSVSQAGAAFDMTLYSLRFCAKEEATDPDDDLVIDEAVTFATPATGVGVLALDHDNTDVKPADYVYEFKLYNAGGSLIQTLGFGTLKIEDVALLSTT